MDRLRLKAGDSSEAASATCPFWINRGRLDEAIACFRKAVELNPKLAPVHNRLGWALATKGRLEEAIACYHKAIELGFTGARPSLVQAERLAKARDRFADFQKGRYTPATAMDGLDLAVWCRTIKRHQTAARLFADAFAADPKLADDLQAAHRYDAACCASLAAAGKGEDAGKLDEKERTRLRKQALDWLRADLVLRKKQLESGLPAGRTQVQWALTHWQDDSDLAAIREPEALAKLSAEDRAACERLWADVAALLKN